MQLSHSQQDMPDVHIPVKHFEAGYAHDRMVSRKLTPDNEGMENLKLIRQERKLTQAELAEMVDCNQATISKIEKGGNYTHDLAIKIARALQVPLTDLFSISEVEAKYLEALRKADPARRDAVLLLLGVDAPHN
ncbi:MAG: helix-turn-helix transcriptional regulator [Rhodobacteraceae bacterium]|nr:helix-turn-helix transcriptional regulator [Paracoccaceae bacterium]MBR9822635.1 helix-turn-helix transcriptional regulator [Paracoccaceae bacterium]